MDIKEIGWAGMDFIHLAQDRDKCQVVVNTVLTFRFHRMQGIS
jgi:hypothetical protein